MIVFQAGARCFAILNYKTSGSWIVACMTWNCNLITATDVVIETAGFKYGISEQGKDLFFTDKKSGIEYLSDKTPSFSASVNVAGKDFNPTSAVLKNGALGDHFIEIDFKGWKYFELVKIKSSEFSNYVWPPPVSSSSFYLYDSYRHEVSFPLQLWYNNLPAGKTVNTLIGSVKALQLVSTEITNLELIIGKEKIAFPVTLKSGMHLEYKSKTDCKLFGPKGEFIQDVSPVGIPLMLKRGNNTITFYCDGPKDVNLRVQITTISEGKLLPNN